MLAEELPHGCAGVDVIGRAPKDPSRQVFSARPGMASTFNGIENYVSIPSAVRVSETADARRDPNIARFSLALVSLGHMGRPLRNICKRVGGDGRWSALVEGKFVRRSMKRDGRHRRGTPALPGRR